MTHTGTREDPVPRPGARVLLLDADDRLLLFRTAPDPSRPNHDIIWMTPGGASDPGETPEQTARRELLEETGFAPELGPCVWERDWVWYYGAHDTWYDTREYFYPARVDAAEPELHPQVDDEMVSLLEHRWLRLEEIASSEEIVSPLRLAELLPAIIVGEYPDQPIETGQ
jgi:8-oxo-dGTP pyrophosphatase MutT (NUDIX family)